VTVLVSGGGIAGMTMALTCHQIGVPVQVLEVVETLKPLGVGINLQPNAVRELFDLGLAEELDAIGIPAKEWALVGRNGNDVWAEPRGLDAGYKWPQYSVHRGELQMMLHRVVVDRLGSDAVLTGHRVESYRNVPGGVEVDVAAAGRSRTFEGDVLLAGDGLNSAIRAQMYPDEGPPKWGGAVMWRGVSRGVPIRSGASFVLVGKLEHRFVCYPITSPDPESGEAVINWIAELTYPVDGDDSFAQSDWNRSVPIEKFIGDFEDWNWDWLDVPALIGKASDVLEYPMVDRDPIDHYVDGNAALMGDAAHVMYPVGSNGASQAIVDARVLGAAFLKHGAGAEALQSYEAQMLDDMNALVLRNRGSGPVGILGVVEERCGGVFDDIEDVIPRSEIEDFMGRYKAAAGFAVEALNAAPPTIDLG
jgi:5-methylphenazine-1-carboxylate 1-monooxygenase